MSGQTHTFWSSVSVNTNLDRISLASWVGTEEAMCWTLSVAGKYLFSLLQSAYLRLSSLHNAWKPVLFY